MSKKEFKLIKDGNYSVKVDKIEIVEAKSNKDCLMAKAELSVTSEGEFKGFKVWQNMILRHPSQGAVKVGTDTLNSLLVNTGNPEIGALNGEFGILPSLLEGKEATAKIYTKESNNAQYGPANRVYRFSRGY